MTAVLSDTAPGTDAPPATPLRKEAAWRRRDRRWGYVFVGPQLIGMAIFVMVPFVASVVLAFAKWDGLTALQCVGFDNFRQELTDPLFGRAILNTLLIALITVPIGLGLAVIIAVALENLRTRTLYLVLFFSPVITSSSGTVAGGSKNSLATSYLGHSLHAASSSRTRDSPRNVPLVKRSTSPSWIRAPPSEHAIVR